MKIIIEYCTGCGDIFEEESVDKACWYHLQLHVSPHCFMFSTIHIFRKMHALFKSCWKWSIWDNETATRFDIDNTVICTYNKYWYIHVQWYAVTYQFNYSTYINEDTSIRQPQKQPQIRKSFLEPPAKVWKYKIVVFRYQKTFKFSWVSPVFFFLWLVQHEWSWVNHIRVWQVAATDECGELPCSYRFLLLDDDKRTRCCSNHTI